MEPIKRSNYVIDLSQASSIKDRLVSNSKTKKEKRSCDKECLRNLRAIIVFIIFSVLFILPLWIIPGILKLQGIKTKFIEDIKLESQEALGSLNSALQDLQTFNLFEAEAAFKQAANDFQNASKEITFRLGFFDKLIKFIPFVGEKVRSAEAVLNLGSLFSNIGEHLSSALNLAGYQTEGLVLFEEHLDKILSLWSQIEKEIGRISPSQIPESLQESFLSFKNKIPGFKKSIEQASLVVAFLREMLGQEQSKRYLFIFQNNTEIRPTGGFIGSLALIDFDRGEIKKIEVPKGGIYDIAGQMTEKVLAPKPLYLVNAHWNIQDANWFPDFPSSAEKILWFWAKSDGPTVDGIISLTPAVIEKFLALTGPVDLKEKYGVVVDQENFLKTTQELTSKKYYETKTPKEFLADLTPIVLEKIFSLALQELPEFLESVAGALEEKHILFYFRDSKLQSFAESLDWTGSLKKYSGDYLGIFRANIRGEKTDQVIEEKINHDIEIKDNGEIISSLEIFREHKGVRGEKFTGARNFTYFRFYVPKGSEILQASGFSEAPEEFFKIPAEEYHPDQDLINIQGPVTSDPITGAAINSEFDKTVFGFWSIIDPGEERVLKITYRLPFPFDLKAEDFGIYRLLFQKQPGTKAIPYQARLQLPEQSQIVWSYPEDLKIFENKITIKEDLNKDKIWAVISSKKEN